MQPGVRTALWNLRRLAPKWLVGGVRWPTLASSIELLASPLIDHHERRTAPPHRDDLIPSDFTRNSSPECISNSSLFDSPPGIHSFPNIGVIDRLTVAKRGAARGRAMSISDPKIKGGEWPGATGNGSVAPVVIDEPYLTAPPLPPVPHDAGGTRPASPPRTISDRDLTLMQVSCDFLCACIALPLSLILLSRLSSARVNQLGLLLTNMKVDSLFPVAVVVALALGGVYRVTHRRLQPSAFLELRELSFGVGCGCVLALAVGSFFHGVIGTAEPFTTQLVMAVIAAIGVITVGRIILRFFLRKLTTTRVLVVGVGTTADRIMLSVRQEPTMTLVGRAVDGDSVDAGAIGKVTDLPELCRQLAVHRILVAASEEFSAESLDVYRRLQNSVHIAMVPHYYELISWRSRLTDLSGTPFLEIAQPHLSAWDRFVKRAFDLCLSSAVLVVMSPLLLVVAVGVKLSSPGPVFFHQVRLGRNAEPFTVTKFRSMTMGIESASDADAGAETDDPGRPLHELRKKTDETGRITRFGARERVLHVETMWADTESADLYRANIRFRALGEPQHLPGRPKENTYLPADIFTLREDESILDCGATKGEMTEEMLRKYGGNFGAFHALEADRISYRSLELYRNQLPDSIREKVILYPYAVGGTRCTVHFSNTGQTGSKISEQGVAVECFPIDELFASSHLTLIKMDIEGAEYEALLGGRKAIERDRPILAICAYHTQNDIWRIPLLVHEMLPRHKLYLRAYEGDGYQTVLFAVPEKRAQQIT